MKIKDLEKLHVLFGSATDVVRAIIEIVDDDDFEDGRYEIMTELDDDGRVEIRDRNDTRAIGPNMDSNMEVYSVFVNKCYSGTLTETQIGAMKHYVWVHVSTDKITLTPDRMKSENLWGPDRTSQIVRIIAESPLEITSKEDIVFRRDPD